MYVDQQVERFFDFHGTLAHLRLQIVAFDLEGPAATWFNLMESNRLLTDWPTFLCEIRLYFDPALYDYPYGCL